MVFSILVGDNGPGEDPTLALRRRRGFGLGSRSWRYACFPSTPSSRSRTIVLMRAMSRRTSPN